MFKNSSKILFSIILVMGTLITISSSSWLGSWMGLEINLLAFIPLMNNTKNLMSSESSMKYFLVQALASSVLLFSIILSILKLNFSSLMENHMNISNLMIMSALLLKSGAAPFHFWFPGVMEGLNWINSLILMTWQKIAPLMLVSYLMLNNLMLYSMMLSIIIGSLGGLNQTSLRKLMAFSSINHIGWMLAAMMSDETLWMFYFSMYTFLSMSIIMMFNLFKAFHFNQLFNMFFSSKYLKFMMFINLLSLGGLPPFLGFLPKWLVIQQLTENNQMMIMTLMVVFTLITLFFYIRLTFTAFMINFYETNWTMSFKINNFNMNMLMVMSFISTWGLVIVSLLFYIL